MNDFGGKVHQQNIARTATMSFRQLDPIIYPAELDPGGSPIDTRIDPETGLFAFKQQGIFPIAIRIAQQQEENWFANGHYELLRFWDDPIERWINPGDVIRWRPLLPNWTPFPRLSITLLARPYTSGG